MAPPRTILIADPDPETLRVLGPALRRRGYQVDAAPDGSRALELTVLRSPDLVLLDEAASVVDARRFVTILRTNPRTESIPVVLTGRAGAGDETRAGHYLKKPLDEEEALARIEQLLRATDAARRSTAGADLGGNLAQLPLPDLLQVLAMNRKTGRLGLGDDRLRGEIELEGGCVTGVTAGRVSGEKALVRLLTLREGQFAFTPAEPAGDGRESRRIEELVLDGLRQIDEMEKLLPSAPAANEVVSLVGPPSSVQADASPAMAEVLSLLAVPRTCQELLDRARAADLEVLRAVVILLARGQARRDPRAEAQRDGAPVLAAHEAESLRSRIGRAVAGKVLLAGGGPLARRAALARFGRLPGFAAEGAGGQVDFGTLGRLTLEGGVRLDLVALPADPALLPLWRPFSAGAIAALLLLPWEGLSGFLPALGPLRFPVGACGEPDAIRDPELAGVSNAHVLGRCPAEALRALLALACRWKG